MVRSRIRRIAVAVLAVGVIVASGMTVVFATHIFPDVATGAFYHNAVEWIFNRGITAGCGGGLYCPNNFVTRGEMAVFMQNLGRALTPNPIVTAEFLASNDIDTVGRVCAQTSDYTPSFPQRVFLNGTVTGYGNGTVGSYSVQLQVSTNSGVSWTGAEFWNTAINFPGPTGQWSQAYEQEVVDLTPGTPYRFAMNIFRSSGTGDFGGSPFCELTMIVLNRNPTTSPLQPVTPPAEPATKGRP